MNFEYITNKAVEKGVETAVEKTLGVKDLKTVKAVVETGAAAVLSVLLQAYLLRQLQEQELLQV